MIIKPSPETPLSVLMLVDLALRAGFDPGVLSVLTTDLGKTPELSDALCKHPLVSKVTFTGSTAVGKLVAIQCSEGLKKLTLELGGSKFVSCLLRKTASFRTGNELIATADCPFVIFDDADLNQALEALMALKWRHAGQACITANRVYVQKGISKKFEDLLVDATKKLKVGHGADEGTTIGPVTTEKGCEKTMAQIEDAKKNGGRVVCGGKRPEGLKGYFFEVRLNSMHVQLKLTVDTIQPTVLADMKPNMLNSREEVFGPLCALYEFETEEEAVRLANDTSMGLASYFFTKDVDRTWRMYENLEAGQIGMNTGEPSSRPLIVASADFAFRQYVCGRDSIWRHQTLRVRQGEREGCGSGGVFDHQIWRLDPSRSLLEAAALQCINPLILSSSRHEFAI